MTGLMAKLVEEKNVQKAWAYQLTQTGYSIVKSDSDFKLDGNYILFLYQDQVGTLRGITMPTK